MQNRNGKRSFASLARGFAGFCAALTIALLAPGAMATPAETLLHYFTGTDGAYPVAGLIADSAGNLYGTAWDGGAFGAGAVFKLSPPANASRPWTETVLYSFKGGTDGSSPIDRLVADTAGNLYGTTRTGGGSNLGTVFRLSPPAAAGGAWTETILHAFKGGADGSNPAAGLIADSAGNLYGTTGGGGASGYGTVFRLAPDGTETVLYSFTGGSDGATPQAGLIADSAGNLYGTAWHGGAFGAGAVFKLVPPAVAGRAWTETVLYSFCTMGYPCSDGAYPSSGLIADGAGRLYGTTSEGGNSASGAGTIFRLAPPATAGGTWTETVLYSFCTMGYPCSDGAFPIGGVIADSAGNLFGTTYGGGAYGGGGLYKGTVFKLAPGGAETVLLSFNGSSDGSQPSGGLIADDRGDLYGTTVGGPLDYEFCGVGCGSVFVLTGTGFIPGTPAAWTLVIAPPHDYFELLSRLTLAKGVGSLDPPTEPVGVQVGAFTATIPVGAFVKVGSGEWDFDGPINGTAIHAKIWLTGPEQYQVFVRAMTALAGVTNPVPVTLALGPNAISASVMASIYN